MSSDNKTRKRSGRAETLTCPERNGRRRGRQRIGGRKGDKKVEREGREDS
jgi:hypothetical protein